ncbi:MAG: hypothetical protein OXI87_05105 [Albidovulum sp.]|nr:hypothetical protein [Albidovulum sp.]
MPPPREAALVRHVRGRGHDEQQRALGKAEGILQRRDADPVLRQDGPERGRREAPDGRASPVLPQGRDPGEEGCGRRPLKEGGGIARGVRAPPFPWRDGRRSPGADATACQKREPLPVDEPSPAA